MNRKRTMLDTGVLIALLKRDAVRVPLGDSAASASSAAAPRRQSAQPAPEPLTGPQRTPFRQFLRGIEKKVNAIFFAPITKRLERYARQGIEKSAVSASLATLSGDMWALRVLVADMRADLARLQQGVGAVNQLSMGMVVPLAGDLQLVRNRLGFVAVDQNDAATTAYLAMGELPEPGPIALVEALLSPGDGFIDAGANVGVFTLVAGRRVGAAGRILACEPDPNTVRLLATTVNVNGLDDCVTIESVAVGRSHGQASFHRTPISGHNSLYQLPTTTSTIMVEVRTLDELTEPGSKWTVVKLDIEGAELDALAGMNRIIADNPNLCVIAEFGPSHLDRIGMSLDAWFDAWRRLDFTVYEIDRIHPRLRPLRVSGLEDVFSMNLLFARGSAPIDRLMESAV